MRIVQLLSGGFDSVGQAMLLKLEGHTIYPMYVRFRRGGGKQSKEEHLVRELSLSCGFEPPHTIRYPIAKDQFKTRNATLCRLAGEYAEAQDINTIAIGTSIFEGSPYYADIPREDLDPTILQAATKAKVITLQKYKAGVLKALPSNLCAVLFKTTSCQMWYTDECGRCYMCVERHAAFIVALGYDHTIYTYDPKTSKIWQKLVVQETRGYNEAI